MKRNIKFLFLLIVSAFISCETLDLDGTEDKNALPPDLLDANYMLNSVQVNFSNFFYTMSDDTRGCVRMVNQFGSYSSAADPQNTQTQWSTAYADILKEVKNMKEIFPEAEYPNHIAVAKILEAYTYVTLVDFYGDVPFSEALLGDQGNFSPKVDSGADIYDAMLVNIDEAIALFDISAPALGTDFYYANDYDRWIKLANSLKIKMYNNLRLTRDVSTEVNNIISSGLYMQSNADDFNFVYNTTTSPTDARHPDYVNNYFGSPAFYLSNSYYLLMVADKSVTDPRLRYFFYRQTSAAPSGSNLPCATNANIPICYIGDGYWGRDHADDTGIPSDAARRTVVGLYPAGGRFDNSRFQPADTSTALNNAEGAGLLNILDYSYVQFMLAELSLMEPGVSGTPLTYLNTGVDANLTKVLGFRPDLQILSPGGTNFVPSPATVSNYKNAVITNYNNATTDAERLNVIVKEFFISCFGNGMEAYNMYRRTGMPLNDGSLIGIQSPVSAAGEFNRSFPYPSNSINNNTNITQHPLTTQVFWDNNPASFID